MTPRNWTGNSRFPSIFFEPYTPKELKDYIKNNEPLITVGMMRSYNDACLGERIMSMKRINYFINLDEEKGILECEAGISIKDIINTLLPRGFFPYVVPGTKFVTVGGAISADIHGKNNHIHGTFCNYVEEMELILPSGEVVRINKGDELFKYVCGGLGLIGVILKVKLRLMKIKSSYLKVITLKPESLEELLELFYTYKNTTFTVGWVDLINKPLGKHNVFWAGEFLTDNRLLLKPRRQKPAIELMSFLLNDMSIKLYNKYYYQKQKEGINYLYFEDFFFPLDGIKDWFKLYGCNGFLQTQVIFPAENSYDAIKELMKMIESYKIYPYLAVIKLYMEKNGGLLSFPMEGFSLALDFKITDRVLNLVYDIEKLALKYGGKPYLVKDIILDKRILEESYGENLEMFRKKRIELGARDKFQSILSRRLEL